VGHTAKYLADQDGAFEVRDCNGRAGHCLEQVISEIPIPWNPLPDPFTIAGDESWTDYRVVIDVRFLSQAPAVIMGRIDSSDVFKDEKLRLPSGYGLRVKPDGAWNFFSDEYKKPTVTLAVWICRDRPQQMASNGIELSREVYCSFARRQAARYD
jgi:hypothetical protein